MQRQQVETVKVQLCHESRRTVGRSGRPTPALTRKSAIGLREFHSEVTAPLRAAGRVILAEPKSKADHRKVVQEMESTFQRLIPNHRHAKRPCRRCAGRRIVRLQRAAWPTAALVFHQALWRVRPDGFALEDFKLCAARAFAQKRFAFSPCPARRSKSR